jgi:hypothetical protein
MRTFAALSLLSAGLLLTGCKKDEPPPAGSANNSSSGNPLTAPVDYLGAAANAQKSSSKTVLNAGLGQAIKMFYAEKGRFPSELKELSPDYLPSIPPPPVGMKYHYDSKTGEVKLVAQ